MPRPFEFHWGKGQITEEASCTGKYTEPAIQLLEYEGGGQGIRFCYYSLICCGGLRSPQCSDRSALIVFGMATRSMKLIFG